MFLGQRFIMSTWNILIKHIKASMCGHHITFSDFTCIYCTYICIYFLLSNIKLVSQLLHWKKNNMCIDTEAVSDDSFNFLALLGLLPRLYPLHVYFPVISQWCLSSASRFVMRSLLLENSATGQPGWRSSKEAWSSDVPANVQFLQ